MLNHVLFFVLGLVALVAGAEALVRGASKIALSLGVSSLVVGLTIVAFGTSAPEMAVDSGRAVRLAGAAVPRFLRFRVSVEVYTLATLPKCTRCQH